MIPGMEKKTSYPPIPTVYVQVGNSVQIVATDYIKGWEAFEPPLSWDAKPGDKYSYSPVAENVRVLAVRERWETREKKPSGGYARSRIATEYTPGSHSITHILALIQDGVIVQMVVKGRASAATMASLRSCGMDKEEAEITVLRAFPDAVKSKDGNGFERRFRFEISGKAKEPVRTDYPVSAWICAMGGDSTKDGIPF